VKNRVSIKSKALGILSRHRVHIETLRAGNYIWVDLTAPKGHCFDAYRHIDCSLSGSTTMTDVWRGIIQMEKHGELENEPCPKDCCEPLHNDPTKGILPEVRRLLN